MLKQEYNVIGVMSGTSLDGLDLAYVNFNEKDGVWSFNCEIAETIPYSKNWNEKLEQLIAFSKEELQEIDVEYTHYLAKTIQQFINKHELKNIDAVCSHGHTALHQPEKGVTYQIGNKAILAKKLNCLVVCDFRVQDVAFGGEGAPLVPIGDKLLFSAYDFCVNLGGFANISTEKNNQRIAFDVCPVNIVLNKYASQLGFSYDDAGKIASSGEVHLPLLEKLNALSFYKKIPPKSLGLEWVRQFFLPIVETYRLPVKDILCTVCEHIAIQISKVISSKAKTSVLITGGGTLNTFLIKRIESLTTQTIIIPQSKIINYKEAIIFGLLGVLKLRGENNCLASVTGANRNHSSGTIYKP